MNWILKNIIKILFICIYSYGYSQITYIQEIYHGGVTGDGYDQWLSNQPGHFDVYIEPGSTIKKAILFTSVIGDPEDRILDFNGTSVILSITNPLNNYYIANYISYSLKYRTIALDVTNLISPNLNSYTISPPIQTGNIITNGLYCQFYLVILYENPLMQLINTNIYINNIQPQSIQSYSISNINSIDLSKPVGLGIHVSHFCDTIQDGSFIKVDGSMVGLIGGADDNSLEPCSGVSSSFYYQNEQLFGLGNDVANTTMNGVDGIANIESYILNNSFFNIEFEYQSNIAPASNPVHQLFLIYTTPCTPFPVSIPSDTTVCYGEQIQLHVSGGQSYEWLAPNSTTGNPAPGLSCSDCPNPVFSADSSMFYTVRVWNNDSCSVVRPLKINVKPLPILPLLSTINAQCGMPTGSIVIKNPKETGELYILSANGDTLVKPIVANQNTSQGGLYAGSYTIYFQDALGCVSLDTVIVIGSVNNTVASFTATPQSGGAPLSVQINNTSQNAQQYNWYLNGVLQTNPFTGFVAPTSGSYEVMLVAWKNDVLCADTATTTVLVYDSLIVSLPNVFTPNGDGVNEYFSIQTNLPVKADVIIFNRWGNEVFSYSGNLVVGMNLLWDAKDVIDGVYFYKIDILIDENEIDCHQNCKVSKEGFITVVR